MRRLEGGDWKSAINGYSLVAYPTLRPVLQNNEVVSNFVEFNTLI